MYRLTTDNPTDNIEASLNLFYVRDGDAFIRGGGDAPDYADISVTDFIRKTARTLCPDMLLPESAEEISFAMAEYLFDGYEDPSGLVALLYTAAWSYAELRERLKAYEDTGLTPERCAEFARADAEGRYIVMRDAEQEGVARLRELAEADKDGRVIVLPCKVGDTVYFALLGRIIEKQVFSIVSFSNSTRIYCDGTSEYFRPEDIGKTFFLAREGAEKALREMEGKG